MNIVYFQPADIKKDFCEIGIISKTAPEYIWYLNEPCKVLIKDVKIIDKEKVTYDKKNRIHIVKR